MTGKFKSIERGFLATAALAVAIGVLTTTLPTSGETQSPAEAEAPSLAADNVPDEATDSMTDGATSENDVAAAPIEQVEEPLVPEPAPVPTSTPEPTPEPVTIAEAGTINALAGATDFTAQDAHVLRLYSAFFDRQPELDGARFWLDEVRNGETIDDIASAFAASPEFAATYGEMDDATFVRTAYRTALGRGIDQDGFNFWIGELGAGMPREKVLVFFTSGEEFATYSSS